MNLSLRHLHTSASIWICLRRCLDLPLPSPSHASLHMNLPLRRLHTPASTWTCLHRCLDLLLSSPSHAGLHMNLPLPSPRSTSVAASTQIGLCHHLHTPTWSFRSQFLTVTFLDNPLSFLYFWFCLILNQCYFLCIYDCDVELFFSFCDCEFVMLIEIENRLK